MNDLRSQVAEISSSNVCSLKLLQSFAGRANHVAALLYTWRPFLQPLWASIYGKDSMAPPGCAWVKQFALSLSWIRAFLKGTTGSLIRNFSVFSFANVGLAVDLVLDASPWGLGGYLTENGVAVAWFSSALTPLDEQLLNIEIASCSSQQVAESLAALVAL